MGAAIALVPPKLSEKELFGCSVDTHRPFAPRARVVVVGVSIAWPTSPQRRVPVCGKHVSSESWALKARSNPTIPCWKSPNVAAYSANSTPDEHHCRSARQLVARTRGASGVRGGPLCAVVPLSWPYAVCESSKAPTQERERNVQGAPSLVAAPAHCVCAPPRSGAPACDQAFASAASDAVLLGVWHCVDVQRQGRNRAERRVGRRIG